MGVVRLHRVKHHRGDVHGRQQTRDASCFSTPRGTRDDAWTRGRSEEMRVQRVPHAFVSQQPQRLWERKRHHPVWGCRCDILSRDGGVLVHLRRWEVRLPRGTRGECNGGRWCEYGIERRGIALVVGVDDRARLKGGVPHPGGILFRDHARVDLYLVLHSRQLFFGTHCIRVVACTKHTIVKTESRNGVDVSVHAVLGSCSRVSGE